MPSAVQPALHPVTDWMITLSLAGRYRARLASMWASYDAQGSALQLLREFDRSYRSELQVSLYCTVAVILMAFDCQKGLSCQLQLTTVASLGHPVPHALWLFSVIYSLLSILVNLTYSWAVLPSLLSEYHAKIWIDNSRRENLRGCTSLPVLLALPHLWAVAFSVAYLWAAQAYSSTNVVDSISIATVSPRGLQIAAAMMVVLSVIHGIRSTVAFASIGVVAASTEVGERPAP